MVGDGGGRHNVVRPGPWLLLVGQVQEKTGRDDEMSSVLVLAQDGRTAPLRTLVSSNCLLYIYRVFSSFYALEFLLDAVLSWCSPPSFLFFYSLVLVALFSFDNGVQ